jgi:hypothetical protein
MAQEPTGLRFTHWLLGTGFEASHMEDHMNAPHRACLRESLATLGLALAAVVLWASGAAAQQPVRAFDELNTRLKIGDRVWVTTVQRDEVTGKITAFGDGTLSLKDRTFKSSEVLSVVERPHDSLKWGAVIGLSIGAGWGIVSAAVSEGDAGDVMLAGVICGGLGAAIGAGIDALVPMPKRLVYKSPGGQTASRIGVAPVLGPRMKGALVTITF